MKINLKKNINIIIDFILLFSILSSIVSGYIIWFILPRGVGLYGYPFAFCSKFGEGSVGNSLSFFSLPRYEWIEIHNWVSIILLLIIMFHLLSHWKYILENIKRTRYFIVSPIKRIAEYNTISILLFIFFVLEAISGFVLWIIIPRGAADYTAMISGSGRTFWGVQRNVWLDFHAWIAVMIIGLIIIHIIIHWKWLSHVLKSFFQNLYDELLKIPKGNYKCKKFMMQY